MYMYVFVIMYLLCISEVVYLDLWNTSGTNNIMGTESLLYQVTLYQVTFYQVTLFTWT